MLRRAWYYTLEGRMNYYLLYGLALIEIFGKSREESTYNAAVVEYSPVLEPSVTPREELEQNVKNYMKIIKETAEENETKLDLIIFPESTLMYSNMFETAAILPPVNDVILCNSTDEKYASFLKELSCAAVQYKTTIIINVIEKEYCIENTQAPIYYNTNIALGVNGSVIARYRKWNLFGEYGKSKPKSLDLPIIRIKNTTFGMMTCFDIQFLEPGYNLTQIMGVENIIFPLNWISELPYLTALQVQQMWALEFNVTLLAAGSSIPYAGAGGSGIFMGTGGAVEYDILPKPGVKVIRQNVPVSPLEYTNLNITEDDSVYAIDTLASSMDDFFMLVDPSITDHHSIVLNITDLHRRVTVCQGDPDNILCCDFDVAWSPVENISENSLYYTYHLAVHNGVRTYSNLYYGGVETCGVIACLNSSISSCGQRFKNYSNVKWPIEFTYISVTGYFNRSDQRIQYPSTLRSSIRPLPAENIEWSKEISESSVIRKMVLKRPEKRLLCFSIFGRDFSRDWDPIRNSTVSGLDTIKVILLLLLSVIFCNIFT